MSTWRKWAAVLREYRRLRDLFRELPEDATAEASAARFHRADESDVFVGAVMLARGERERHFEAAAGRSDLGAEPRAYWSGAAWAMERYEERLLGLVALAKELAAGRDGERDA